MTTEPAITPTGRQTQPGNQRTPLDIDDAMRVWDTLTREEQRNVFQGTAQAVADYRATSDRRHLLGFADSVEDMVVLEQQPGFTEFRRRPPKPPTNPTAGIGIAAVVAHLRGRV